MYNTCFHRWAALVQFHSNLYLALVIILVLLLFVYTVCNLQTAKNLVFTLFYASPPKQFFLYITFSKLSIDENGLKPSKNNFKNFRNFLSKVTAEAGMVAHFDHSREKNRLIN